MKNKKGTRGLTHEERLQATNYGRKKIRLGNYFVLTHNMLYSQIDIAAP